MGMTIKSTDFIGSINQMSYCFPNYFSNCKELPGAFLRRCFFHYIKFPTKEQMQQIVEVHHPNVKSNLLSEALETFFDLREVNGIKKKPSTSELIDWMKLLLADDIAQSTLIDKKSDVVPLLGALIKNEQDSHLLEKLAFLSRRQR
jgi:MoxR-like ATPase